MPLMWTHEGIIIAQFGGLSFNKTVQPAQQVSQVQRNNTMEVKYALIPFKGYINPRDTQGIKLYLQAMKEK